MKKFVLAFLVLSLNLSLAYAEDCLDGQDPNAIDVDLTDCPAIPNEPQDVRLGTTNQMINLGAWELGTTKNGETYKYGTLTSAQDATRSLVYYDGTGKVEVDEVNLECWAKGYYRLRQILQNPPASYVKLRQAGFQVRFFQFQTDLRNGTTGYREVSSYRDHLVKWVTIVDENGTCSVPTLSKFEAYVAKELARRSL